MKRKNRTTPTRLFNSRPAQPLPHPKSSNNTTSDKLVVEWMFAPQRGQCSFNVATDDEITVHRTSSATKHPKNLANLKLEKHQRTRLLGKTFFKLSEFSTKSDKRLSTPNFTFL
ncbi:hypothetical protein T4B_11307 [Trichinella pseudospiralis]|uniref:Uncharacterized protein n=1 Tax=Trichinella pseudospiralis TaxID=6337 RepID=A0A0V1J2E2_TRIPS|nr:hypothetical protein T4B_11307 [Trichinella pseudospiralis]